MAKSYWIPLLVMAIVLFTENTTGFPKQAVFVTELEGEQLETNHLLSERAARSLDLDLIDLFYSDGSGDGELPEEAKLTEEPVPPIRIGSLHVLSSTTARFTNTSVTSKLVNRANVSQETEVTIRLPDEAFITELFIEVDGQIYRSIVETKEKAQKIYDTARERGQTASQVKQTSEETNDFSVSINVEPLSAVKCTLIYQQLLLRTKGYFENKISIRPKQVIPDLKVNVYINEPQGLDEVKFWLQKEEGNDFTSNELKEQNVDLTSSTRAHIQFQPSKEEQLAQSEHGIVGDFVIKYDVVHEINGGNIQVVNGYFVHYFSPEGIPPVMKNVVFVIDVSGSMSGTKIQQTREAMLTILDQLREGDTFNIVTFDSTISTWQPGQMVPVTPDMIKSAKAFARELEALTSTNFYGGIEQGVSLLDNFHKAKNDIYIDRSLSMIIILSDGQPTSGITNLNQIKENTKESINGRYSLFTLGFGNDVDHAFLEKLAGQNKGIFRKIFVDSNSGLQLAEFFDDVATPLLLDVQFKYPDNVIDNNIVTDTTFSSYFQGSELVIAGKLMDTGILEEDILCLVRGTTTEYGTLGIQATGSVQISENVMLHPHAVGNFTQRLWAYLTIQELLGKRRISDDNEEKESFKERALELSLKYHFVTSLTSLVVVKPEGNDTTDENPKQDEPERGHISSRMSSPSQPGGHAGGLQYQPGAYNMQMGPRGPSTNMGGPLYSMVPLPGPLIPPSIYQNTLASADSDPHFLLHVPNGNVTICFDIMAQQNNILNLISDTQLGLYVNAKVQRAIPHPELLKKKNVDLVDISKRTVFDEMAVLFSNNRILISSSGVVFNGVTMPWSSDWYTVKGDFSLAVRDGKFLHVTVKEDVKLVFMLHAVNKKHPGKSDYLGLYVEDGSGFSDIVHGIIGQFQRHEAHLYSETIYEDINLDKTAVLRVKDRTVEVKHASRDVLLTGTVETCWFGKNNGFGMIDGTYNDYLQDNLFNTV